MKYLRLKFSWQYLKLDKSMINRWRYCIKYSDSNIFYTIASPSLQYMEQVVIELLPFAYNCFTDLQLRVFSFICSWYCINQLAGSFLESGVNNYCETWARTKILDDINWRTLLKLSDFSSNAVWLSSEIFGLTTQGLHWLVWLLLVVDT